MTHRGAVGLVLAAAVLWSFGGVLIKFVDWHPLAVSATRSAFAAITVWALAPRLHFTRSPWLWGGAVAYAATVVLLVTATKLTTAANAIILQYTAPVWVALLAPLVLGEPTRRTDWAVLSVVVAGLVLFFADDLAPGGHLGNILALVSGLTYAVLALCLRRQKDGARFETVVAGNVLAFLVGVPFLGGAPAGFAPWAALVVLGVLQLGLAYFLYARALGRVTALEASLLPMMEPVLNPLWVFLALGEQPSALALLGGGVVLAAVSYRAWVAWRDARPGR